MAKRKKAIIKKLPGTLKRSLAMKRAWKKRKAEKTEEVITRRLKADKPMKELGDLKGFASGNAPQTVSRDIGYTESDFHRGYQNGLSEPMPGGIDVAEKRYVDTLNEVDALERQQLRMNLDLIDARANTEKTRLQLEARIKGFR